MTNTRIPLAELREQIGAILGHASQERIASSLLSEGIPRGALVELTGPSRVEWCLAFLREHPKLKVCWIEEKFTLFPPAIKQRGCNLEHFLFVEAGAELFKPLRKAIRSQVFDVLIAPSAFADDRALKALQLLTEKANAALFLLGSKPRTAWQISVQLECLRTPVGVLPLARVLKYKTRDGGKGAAGEREVGAGTGSDGGAGVGAGAGGSTAETTQAGEA